MMHSMYRAAREAAGLSRDAAAPRLFTCHRSLIHYEDGSRVPAAEVVERMADVYQCPELMHAYCHDVCGIGQKLRHAYLDGANLDLASVLLKLGEELAEAQRAVPRLQALAVNRRSRAQFQPAEWAEFTRLVGEIQDVAHVFDALAIALGRLFGVSAVYELVAAHNGKLRQRGYVRRGAALRGRAAGGGQ